MKAIVWNTELGHELESSIHLVISPLQRICTGIPWEGFRTRTKRVAASIAEAVPIGDSVTKNLLHRFAGNDALLVVPAIGQGVVGLRTFKTDLSDAGKIFLVTKSDRHVFYFFLLQI